MAIGPAPGRDYNGRMRNGGSRDSSALPIFCLPSALAGSRRVLTFLVLVAVAAALGVGYYVGHSRRGVDAATAPSPPPSPVPPAPAEGAPAPAVDGANEERARLIRSYEAEAHALRRTLANRDATVGEQREFATERQELLGQLARSRADAARYRQLVLDLENNAPPPLFGTGAPDDLKLIVGIGPVLERMLHQLGVATYRQIAHWSERDIDDFDARLPEFPGRIRRDAWVVQARELHLSKFGERP